MSGSNRQTESHVSHSSHPLHHHHHPIEGRTGGGEQSEEEHGVEEAVDVVDSYPIRGEEEDEEDDEEDGELDKAEGSLFDRTGGYSSLFGDADNQLMMEDELKIVLLGSSRVGKTAFLRAYQGAEFTEQYAATSSASYVVKNLDLDGSFVRVCLWDTPGHELFRSFVPHYYEECDAVIALYSLARPDTHRDALGWLMEVSQFGPKNVVLALLGTHSDVASSLPPTSTAGGVVGGGGTRFSAPTGCLTAQASMRDPVAVHDFFQKVIQSVIQVKFSPARIS